MPIDMDAYGKQFLEDYNHKDFEVVLTKYRKKRIVDLLKNYNTDRMLEIGCGMEPFFLSYSNYREMVIVEPANIMFNHILLGLEMGVIPNISIVSERAKM